MIELAWRKEAAGEYVSNGYLAYRERKGKWILYLNDPDRPGQRVSKPFPTLRDAKAATAQRMAWAREQVA